MKEQRNTLFGEPGEDGSTKYFKERDKLFSDEGKHYRYTYKGVQLDPYRIAQVYNITDFAMLTVLKKVLCAGSRGHKSLEQDIKDCICALERKLEMLDEDKE